jgi:hypothetical protein
LYKIGQEAPVSRVAAEVFGGKPNSEQYRQAWALARAADLLHTSGLRPAGKTGLAADAQNRLFAVQSMAATDFSGGNLALRVDGILNHLGTRVENGANGLYSNWTIVDTSRLTPEQTGQFRSALLDRAARSGRLEDLRRVIRLSEEGGEASRLFSDQEIALAAAKPRAAGGQP